MNASPPLNILLAEDERSVAWSIVFALKCDGHKVQVVADGAQALASLGVEPDAFHLLITDHSMPGMTGVDLVRRLREASFRGKIMVLSAHLSPDNRAAYEALAVDAMMSKPFDVHQCAPRSRGSRTGSSLPRRRIQFSSRRLVCKACLNRLCSKRMSRRRVPKTAFESTGANPPSPELRRGRQREQSRLV